MSTIPYNYGKYIDDKVSMSNSGTVDAGRQAQSPASAGSRGLAKTTQFTKDPTQMKMGNSPIAESIIEIRNILNRIDVPVREDTNDDIIQWAKKYSQYKNLEDDNLIEALYEYAFELGIAQLTFEVGELQARKEKLERNKRTGKTQK
jgi:hypothetical protein